MNPQGMAAPTVFHARVLDRVLGYVKATTKFALHYTPLQHDHTININTYIDADFAGEQDRKSISGLLMRLERQAPYHWRSSKQSITAKSSTEAELIAVADYSDALLVHRRLMGELKLLAAGPSSIYEDNSAAIAIIRDYVYSGRVKHLEVRLRATRERERNGSLRMKQITTDQQLADIFTKGLPRDAHEKFVRAIFAGGNVPASTGARGKSGKRPLK